ncbi:hypothetical protein [Caballeronia terrestris]|uniref:hypothetical protein n=1 Tax=Caballeronia terrestris TaxID=1226301 RepID=UPI000B3E6DDF|nr:hypothetical protein [Caballeronia terrestris]
MTCRLTGATTRGPSESASNGSNGAVAFDAAADVIAAAVARGMNASNSVRDSLFHRLDGA